MAVFMCKMCGGSLSVNEGDRIAVCEYCGSHQTVPNADNEKKLMLFGRANRLRMACEFDKASAVYESIAAEFPGEAECYWGLVLCKYGIEYVDDPGTGKKIPTCHRSSFDSVMEDLNFEQAMENADVASLRLYREEAKAIEELRKGILAVSSGEEPYDIFICYKETDEKGDRTVDSLIAQNIYDALTEKGYRVFFSRISMEDKLGQAYEPYIFSALHSARIMLAVGTAYEYYNAVWVKNEWSRYLQMIARGENKTLIPCFKGLDAYDMPKEFAHLQAQDMGKVGAIQDLVRGIGKILPPPAPMAAPGMAPAATAGGPGLSFTVATPEVATMLNITGELLANKKWGDVSKQCKKILELDPLNVMANIYHLARVRRVTRVEDLGTSPEPLCNSSYYTKALKYATPDVARQLQAWNADSEENCRKAEARCAPGRVLALQLKNLVAAGKHHTVAVMPNGTVKAVGNPGNGRCDVGGWRNIVAVACGENHTVGLRADGTVVATGSNEHGQCNVSRWKHVIAIDANTKHTMGLLADGTVVSCGEKSNLPEDPENWKGLTEVSCGLHHTVARKADGTVIACGSNKYHQCDVEKWSDVVQVQARNVQTLALKKNGIVVADGDDEGGRLKVKAWQNVIQIACGTHHSLALKADGTVISCGSDGEGRASGTKNWTDIVCLVCGAWHTLGIRRDGTLVACGDRDDGKCEVAGWKLWDNLDDLGKERLKKRTQQRLHDVLQNRQLELVRKRNRMVRGLLSGGNVFTMGILPDGSYCCCGNGENGRCRLPVTGALASVSCGEDYALGLHEDGTVCASGVNEKGRCDVSEWTDMVSVSAGFYHSVGLRADGAVLSCGDHSDGACDVYRWHNMRDAQAGYYHTVGLRSDGTVVAVGGNGHGQCNVSDWRNITAIATCNIHTVGLRTDGTVVATGNNEYGQCNVSGWKDIVQIACGTHHTVGLRSDGTVVATGYTHFGRLDVDGWRDVVAVVCGQWYTMGIRSNGTILSCGCNEDHQRDTGAWRLFEDIHVLEVQRKRRAELRALRGKLRGSLENWVFPEQSLALRPDGRLVCCSPYGWNELTAPMQNWTGIVSVAFGNAFGVGLKVDGTVIATGKNDRGQCNVAYWSDIVAVACGAEHTVGLRANGTVVAAGSNERGACAVSGWRDVVSVQCTATGTFGICKNGTIQYCGPAENGEDTCGRGGKVAKLVCVENAVMVLRTDGTVKVCTWDDDLVSQVKQWRDIVDVACTEDHFVGLCADGTVVACGENNRGQCDTAGWTNVIAVVAGADYTTGLRSDGTLVTCGCSEQGAELVGRWRNIMAITNEFGTTWALREDGTLLQTVAGQQAGLQCRVYGGFEHLKAKPAVRIPTDPAWRQNLQARMQQLAQFRRTNGKCLHCGGDFKGLMTKKCGTCGAIKDY